MLCGFENFNNSESPFDVAVVERFERSSKRTRKNIKENLLTSFYFLFFEKRSMMQCPIIHIAPILNWIVCGFSFFKVMFFRCLVTIILVLSIYSTNIYCNLSI